MQNIEKPHPPTSTDRSPVANAHKLFKTQPSNRLRLSTDQRFISLFSPLRNGNVGLFYPHGSVLPAEDVTCNADCGWASLAATSEPAGGGWDHTEPTAENRPSRLLLSAGFTFLFFPLSSRSADPTLLDTRVFLAVATHGSVGFFFFSSCNEEEKKEYLRLISLGHE